MKKIYKGNDCNAEGMGKAWVSSRITMACPLLTLVMILMLGAWSVPAWALDEYVTVEDYNTSTTYSGTNLNKISNGSFSNKVNKVTFKIADVSYSDSWGDRRLEYSSQGATTVTSQITWTADKNYEVCVTSVSMDLRGYQAVFSRNLKTANAYLTDGKTSTGTQDCKTNGTSAKPFEISATKINSPLSLVKSTTGNSNGTIYKIPTITFTYKVTHKEYLFGFSATTGVNNGSYGSATATVAKSTVQAEIGVTSASTTATFTATPAAGCQFLGWSTSSDGSSGYESTANPYKPTINNNTAGSTANKTLYAIFDNKQPQSITWNETLAGKVRGNVVTLNATASSGLAVTYTASPADLVSISGNQVTCLKAGTVTITANQAGNSSYHPSSNTPAKSFTIIEHAITKNPTATGITYEQTLSNSTLSGGTSNVEGTWAWKYPNSVPGAGKADQIAVFTPTSTVIPALECNVSVTVAKATPDVTCTIANSYEVDDASLDLQTLWTREGNGVITYSVYSFAESGENNGGGTTPYVENNQYLHLQKAGTAKVVMSIAEGTNYVAHNETIDVVINKIENTLYAKGSTSYAPTMYTDKTITGVTLTAINTDYAGSPISVEQTAGNAIVSYAYNQASHSGTVSSNHKLGTATWTISQAENYKYTKAEGSFSVTVVQKDEQECYLLNEATEYSIGKYGDAPNGQWLSYSWDGRPETLKFKMWKWSNANDIGNHVYVYDANGNEITSNSKDYPIAKMSTTEQEYTIDLSENARSVKFQNGGGEWATASTLNTYIKDIKVTRKTWLNVGTDNNAINGTLTINKREDGVHDVNPGQKGVKNTSVYWSCAGGGDLKIACDNGKFTFSPSTISNVACASDVTPLTVTYTSDIAGEETATVMVYNDVYYRTFTVKGVVEYADQTITWNKDVLSIDNSYTGVATANNRVTYSSADESIIRVDEDEDGYKTILTTIGTGNVDITATAEGDNFYAEKVSVKSIQVTDKLIQWIEWNQSLFNLKVGDDNVTMNAHASSNVAGCVSSRLIEYTSSDESVVKVVNSNQLQIMGVGTAVVTATQAGGIDADGHDYEAASTVKTVVVHDPNAPCESFVYQQAEEVRFDLGWNALDKQTRSEEINFNGKSPAACTFKYKGEHKTVWPVNYYDGTMYVEEYYEGSWHSVENGNLGQPTESSYKTASMTLNKKSTKMRIVASNGLGYHYFTDCQVEQARFIETTAPVAFVANVGQTVKQEIYLSYSNITDDITLSMGVSENPHFSVDVTRISGSCGDYANNVKLTISYNSNVEESNVQDVLTITDGKTKCEVVLTGSASRVSQTINWDHADVTNVYTVHTEPLSAESRTALDVEASNVLFSFANNSTATGNISNTNELSFTSAGVAYIVAYTEESNMYYPAPNIVKQWNVSKTPTTITTPLPSVQGTIIAGTAAEDVVLENGAAKNTVNNGAVTGTFKVISPTTLNAGTYDLTIEFKPDNENMYSRSTATLENVTVSQITPEASELDVTVGHITYGQRIDEASLTNAGSMAGHWYWVDEAANQAAPAVNTYNNLDVYFVPEDNNYATVYSTVSVTVDKATPTLNWTSAPTALAYNATDAVYTAESNSDEGAISYSIVSGGEYAEIVAGTGALTILVPGHDITVKATQAASANYNVASITKVVTIAAAPVVNTFTNATGNGDWGTNGNWSSGSKPEEENPNVIVTGALEIDENVTVGNLTIEKTGSIAVITNGTLTVNGTSEYRSEYGDVHVLNDGELALGSSADLQVRHFTLDAKLAGKNNLDVKEAAASGQVERPSQLTINGEAYFQMTFDPKGKISFGWYDFVVPFPVNISDGIYREGNLTNHLVSGVDFIVQEYSEIRNANKQKAWSNFYGTLQPGRVYTITFNYDPNFDQNVFVFKKASGAAIGGPMEFATQYTAGSGDTDDCGWNGLGNGTLQHGYITGTYAKMQVYNHAENKYDLLTGKNPSFAVGTSFFVQVGEAHPTMEWNKTEDYDVNPLYAPKREAVEVEEFLLSLRGENQVDASDHLYFSGSEEATEEYVIGHDLRKMGNPTEAKTTQMWATKNGKNLCDIETRMENYSASSDINFYAPQAGTYELTVEEMPDNATLYLTQNGRVVWNLSMSPCELDLTKGTTEGYGLRIVADRQTTTDVENTWFDNQPAGAKKVLIDDQIYIVLPDGKMYDIVGKSVKF